MDRGKAACRLKLLLAAAALAGGAAVPRPASAQSSAEPNNPASAGAPTAPADGQGLADIVVTAQRVEQSQQKVPISVSTITGNDLEQKSIGNIADAARSLPNVVATNGSQGATDANFFIRGVGQFDFIITNDPGVGVYVDGVYLGRTLGAQLDSLDLDRLEVLRGPQGTLFGRNTLGGAVNVVTTKPTLDSFYGTAQVDVGYDLLHAEQFSVNVPITPDFAIHVAGVDRGEGGYAYDPYNNREYGEISTQGGRVTGLWKPSDPLRVEFEADYTHEGGTQLPVFLRGYVPGAPVSGLNLSPYVYNPNRNGTVYDGNNPDNRADAYGGSVTVTYDADVATLKSITAARGLHNFNVFDGAGSPYSLYQQTTAADQRQFSQELQAIGTTLGDRLTYITGLYYYHENAHQNQSLCLAPGFNPYSSCVAWNQDLYQDTDSYAAYGNATVRVFDGVSAVFGGRVNYDQKHLETTQALQLLPGGPVIEPIITGGQADHDWRNFTPKLGLNWQVTDENLLYASWTRGFRSGGFGGRILIPGTPIIPYKPDTNSQYEVGSKNQFLDNRVRLNVAGFYSTYRDIQQTVSEPVIGFKVANAGTAEVYGFETELTVEPMPRFILSGGAGYTYSRFTTVDPGLAASLVFVGNRLPFAPLWNGVASAQYTFDLPGEGGTLNVRADMTAQSAEFFSPGNLPLERQQGFALLNLRATYTLPGGRYRFGAFVRNLADTRYFTFGEDARFNQGVAYGMLARGVDFGFTAATDF